MTGQSLSMMAGALIAVLALIGGAARLVQSGFWRRTLGAMPALPGRSLQIRESLALDPKRRLMLIQCGERQVVLLTGGPQDVVVGWIEPS